MRPEVDQLNVTAHRRAWGTSTTASTCSASRSSSSRRRSGTWEKLTPMLAKRLAAGPSGTGACCGCGLPRRSMLADLAQKFHRRGRRSDGSGHAERVRSWLKPTETRPHDDRVIEAAPSPVRGRRHPALSKRRLHARHSRRAAIGAAAIADRIWSQVSAEDKTKVVAAGQMMEQRLTRKCRTGYCAIDDTNCAKATPGRDARCGGPVIPQREAERLARRCAKVPADLHAACGSATRSEAGR